jgi:HNH endonuclease
MYRDGFVLHNKSRNRVALAMLKKLSSGVDTLRDQLRKGSMPKKTQPIYRDYLLTVQGDTDSAATRERRAAILRGLLGSLYERKDDKRSFSAEQRRIIWNSEEQHNCPRCHRHMTWDDFTIDHIISHVRGGRTSLRNAQVMCRRCNSRKGGR